MARLTKKGVDQAVQYIASPPTGETYATLHTLNEHMCVNIECSRTRSINGIF